MTELPPRDAAVALRSFPRRFREAIERAEAADPGSGQAILPLIDQATDAVVQGAQALGIDVAHDIEQATSALAAAVERATAQDWANDEAKLAAVREAVRAAAAALRGAEG